MSLLSNGQDDMIMFLMLYPFLIGENGSRKGKATRERRRRSVSSVYLELGKYYFRRAHRMSYQNFCKLHELLKDGIRASQQRRSAKQKRTQLASLREGPPTNPAPLPPNGFIHTSVRLAVAL